ncbi:MAG: type II toxin-antitoxin system death-on-curing family toxin [Oscillospiraceae bacterium]|jgi:death-on-curing protein|nr:type II toxin-antitoxin system death-on-curing family toxin [Oscillospiraceae bacterium]
MITLKKNEVLELHKLAIQEHGGSHGVRDEGLLESAIYMPYMTFDGIDLYPSIEEKAAQLCFGLVKNHPFVDGNKRIGTLCMLLLLRANRVEVKCTEPELQDCILSLSRSELSPEELAAWLKTHIAEE